MTKLTNRLTTKGPKVGPCNICGERGQLTEDHIPPKGVSRIGQVAMMNIIDLLSTERPDKSTRYFQDGVKYRTLCKTCNNERLGVGYDPALISVSNNIRSYLESSLYRPQEIQIPVKQNRLVRSVVGHVLAHGTEEHRNGLMIEKLTDYFLDESAPFPSDTKLYYWVYPYNDQVVVKGGGFSPHYFDSFAVFMLMKFFPISFFFVIEEPPAWTVPAYRLDTLLTARIDDEVSLPVRFTDLPPQRWPEAPGKSGAVLYSENGATGAVPHLPRQSISQGKRS